MTDFPIITKLGGRKEVFAVLRARGHSIGSLNTIRMWHARDSIPGDAQRALMAEADRRSIAYNSVDFHLRESA